jgi:hypothetical protein
MGARKLSGLMTTKMISIVRHSRKLLSGIHFVFLPFLVTLQTKFVRGQPLRTTSYATLLAIN